MTRLLGVTVLLGCGLLAGCSGGSDCSIPAGKSIAVARTGATGACPAAVVAGVTSLNGSETFTPAKAPSCGVTHFTLNVTFFAQDANHTSCTGTDTIAFADLTPDGGTGTDTMSITCTDSTTCSETFTVTFTPQ